MKNTGLHPRIAERVAWRVRNLKRRLTPRSPIAWPDYGDEIGEWKRYLTGRCLNAGAGNRDISGLVDGEVVNLDIPGGLHNDRIHIYSPLEQIPVPDGHFDSIICNAVLEHVLDSDAVLKEFFRVLRRGGYLYLAVPFLQPWHPDPKDFRRFTGEGLCAITERHGFRVLHCEVLCTVYHTLAWIVDEWLMSDDSWRSVVLRWVLFPMLRNRCLHSRRKSDKIASGFRLIAVKDAVPDGPGDR